MSRRSQGRTFATTKGNVCAKEQAGKPQIVFCKNLGKDASTCLCECHLFAIAFILQDFLWQTGVVFPSQSLLQRNILHIVIVVIIIRLVLITAAAVTTTATAVIRIVTATNVFIAVLTIPAIFVTAAIIKKRNAVVLWKFLQGLDYRRVSYVG